MFHIDFHSGSYGNIKLFTENVYEWTEVQQNLNARKKGQKKPKHDILEILGQSFKCNYGYHRKCYKNFTAVSVSQVTKPWTSIVCTRLKVLSNRATQKNESSKSNILLSLCIICATGCQKYKGNIIDIGKCNTFDAEVTIRNASKYLKDETLLSKIGSYEFGNETSFAVMEAKYHHVCKREYTRSERNKKLRKINTVFIKKKESLLH